MMALHFTLEIKISGKHFHLSPSGLSAQAGVVSVLWFPVSKTTPFPCGSKHGDFENGMGEGSWRLLEPALSRGPSHPWLPNIHSSPFPVAPSGRKMMERSLVTQRPRDSLNGPEISHVSVTAD